jgi:pimeloyl-ACP methyl ester carboxylesterase
VPYFAWEGHRLYFRQRGEGPLLILLHGNTASSACHLGELDHWSDRYCVVAPDLLGTGRSDRVDVWADDWWGQGACQAVALVDHLGREACVVVGTSGGGVATLLMAIRFPERVRAAIADSCVARFSPEMAARTARERAGRTPDQVAFWRHAHGADWEQVVDGDTEVLRRLAGRGGDWFGGRLREIACPVLITASLQDEALLDVARQVCGMAEQVPNCTVFLNNRGGHPLMWSCPDDFRYVSDRFLRGLDGP